MWILRKIESYPKLAFQLSGRIRSADLTALKELIGIESGEGPFVLDLSELKLVDAGVIAFFGHCEAQGTELRNCPAYIREWIEKGFSAGDAGTE